MICFLHSTNIYLQPLGSMFVTGTGPDAGDPAWQGRKVPGLLPVKGVWGPRDVGCLAQCLTPPFLSSPGSHVLSWLQSKADQAMRPEDRRAQGAPKENPLQRAPLCKAALQLCFVDNSFKYFNCVFKWDWAPGQQFANLPCLVGLVHSLKSQGPLTAHPRHTGGGVVHQQEGTPHQCPTPAPPELPHMACKQPGCPRCPWQSLAPRTQDTRVEPCPGS